MSNSVILLNMDYQYINRISERKAIRLIAKGKVTVEKYSDKVIRTVKEEIVMPLVLRLVYLVRQIYRKSVSWSKKNVMLRDSYKCVYCGSTKELNIDHIMPKSRGGKNTFENTVASCQGCNNYKGNRTPSEAKMYFTRKGFVPYQPTVMEFIKKHLDALGVHDVLVKAGIY